VRFSEALVLTIVVVTVVSLLSVMIQWMNLVLVAISGYTGQSITVWGGWVIPYLVDLLVVVAVVILVVSALRMLREEE